MLNKKSIKDLVKYSSPTRIKKTLKPVSSLKKVNRYSSMNKLAKSVSKKELNLNDYMFTKKKTEIIEEIHTENTIFKHIEKNAKAYEDEIVKFLGISITEPAAKNETPAKEFPKPISAARSKQLPVLNHDWKFQLRTIDKEEVQLKRSLQDLDLKHNRSKKKLALSPISLSPEKNINFVEKSAFRIGRVLKNIKEKSKNPNHIS